jgi:ATP-binding cassette subfamily C protein
MDHSPRAVALPPPRKRLDVSGLVVTAPGSTRALVQGASFSLEAGQSLGLIGPSGAGKSSLARAIAGVWPAAVGEIRLDGALADQWDQDVLGRSIGYLPQDVELFDGSIAENIARLEPEVDSESVLRAARAAGAHEMIVAMPQGYETRIGEGGAALSGGQRQRIALARALYRDPFLLVLDEPNSSLDAEGDEALNQALKAVRERGGIVIVVTHRPAGLAAVDSVAVLGGGRIRALGPRDEILKQVMPRNRPEIQDVKPRKAAS